LEGNVRTLDGQVALITGGNSGIGRATAIALAAEGAAVAISGRKQESLDDTAAAIAEHGGRALARQLEVTDEAGMQRFVDDVISEFGRLNVFVNNAGLAYQSNIQDGNVAEWREMLETNVLGLLIGCREAVRAMKQNEPPRGTIVNISSVAAKATGPSGQVYSGTKHAVNAITDGLRQEVHDLGIRVVVVMPGGTLTNIARNLPQEFLDNAARALGVDPEAEGVRHGEYLPQEGIDRVLTNHPGVMLSADDIARAVTFAVTQPASVHVDEVLVRPSVGLNLGG
jgi:NADP-dependent 3-hydroxy acid dehydrogenase YdfG